MSKEKIDLSIYGIEEPAEIFHNLSYEELFLHETNSDLKTYEKGFETDTGAVAVDTGIFTGRSPKDKYIVKENMSGHNIWWSNPEKKGSDNKPINEEVWNDLLGISQKQLSGKKLYVTDAYCGANENSRIKIRVITEVAWMSHFVKNMFITPKPEELENFEPDFIMLNACKAVNPKWVEHGLNSDVYVAFNLKEKMAVVGGTWYGGEIKKGFFSIMNYFFPLRGIASMHCSANMGPNGDTAIFFGLSGTGKTTLSADPERFLIGDDEHGWDDDGIFNFEGGCYAKCINLSKENEPDIYNAIRRNALLENVVYDEESGEINFKDSSKTENTRVSYPLEHISNIVRPISKGGHPKNIIFLTADAFGVFPPVSKLTKDQAMYYFLSGYTAKLAGTERGIKEPMPAFSSAFGAAFLLLHPTVYAEQLGDKMEKHGASAFLVNTGWIGGPYGIGKRIDIQSTRNIIKSILDGSINDTEYIELPTFGLHVPKHVNGVEPAILNPRKNWKYETAYVKQAESLAEKFIANFENFTDTDEGKRLVAAGPKNKFMKQYYQYYERKVKGMQQNFKEEIARLKDQIFILQNSFSEYISFNSINTDYKKRKLHRHIPVEIFVGTEDQELLKNTISAVNNLIEEAGFSFYKPDNNYKDFIQCMARSNEPLDIDGVYEAIDRMDDAFLNISKGINCSDTNMIEAVKKLIDTSTDVNNIVVKMGPLLILKTIKDAKHVELQTRRLSISGLIHVDKNMELLKNPQKLISELNSFTNIYFY